MRTFLLCLFLLLMSGVSYAFTGTRTITYDEPESHNDGTALTDLSHISIYYFNGNIPIKAIDVPASKPTGGGKNITTAVIYTVPFGTTNISFYAIGVMASNNETPESNTVVKKIIMPSTPGGLK